MIRGVLIFACIGFIFLSSPSANAQTTAGTGSGGNGNGEMIGDFPSLESLSVKPGGTLEDIVDAA